jgi:ParB/RepB/Spo0J family partition protein
MTTETALAPCSLPLAPVETYFADISVELIARNPRQPRRQFAPEALQELADSLVAHGQLQPIALRAVDLIDPDDPARPCRYALIMGERRWRAARAIPWASIQAKVYAGVDEATAHEMALVENLERAALNPMEEAEALADLKSVHHYTQEQIADRVYHGKKSRGRVANLLRLLELPAAAQAHVRAGALTQKHAEALLRFREFPAVIEAMADLAVKRGTAAGELGKGLPFDQELDKAGVVVAIDYDAFEGTGLMFDDKRVFDELKAQPWICVVKGANTFSNDHVYALDAAQWEGWIGAKRAAYQERVKKEAAKKQAELDLRAAEKTEEVAAVKAGAKTKAAAKLELRGPVDLSKLAHGSFAELDELPAAIRKQIPAEKIELGIARWGSEKHKQGDVIEFTRDVNLVRSLQARAAAKKNKLVRAQLDAALDVMLETVGAIKTVNAGDLALIAGYAIATGYPGDFADEDFEAIGENPTEELHKLEPVQIIKLTLVHKLRGEWYQARRDAKAIPGNLEAYAQGYEQRLEQKQAAAEKAQAAKLAKPSTSSGQGEGPAADKKTTRRPKGKAKKK